MPNMLRTNTVLDVASPNLIFVRLTLGYRVTVSHFPSCFTNFVNLKVLVIQGFIQDFNLTAISKLLNLTNPTLAGFTGCVTGDLSSLQQLSCLSILILWSARSSPDVAGNIHLLSSLKELTKVKLGGLTNITGNVLSLQKIVKLRLLHIHHSPNASCVRKGEAGHFNNYRSKNPYSYGLLLL